MSDYQIEIFTGNLGKDPESRFTPSGQKVCSFSVASNRQYTAANGEQVKETTWRRVSVFGKLADTCETYLRKGSRVLVEGRLNPDKNTGGPRVWSKDGGEPSASFDVVASSVTFMSPKPEGATPAQTPFDGVALPPEDDLPF
jgi:single-strand DNA-binding protein